MGIFVIVIFTLKLTTQLNITLTSKNQCVINSFIITEKGEKMHEMQLVQLNEHQLEKLIESSAPFQYLRGAIPPKHVLMRALTHYRNGLDQVWASPYFIKVNGKIVGCCGFKNSPESHRVEIGYHLAFAAQGRGIAASAVNRLCQIAFATQHVKTVVALIASENHASLNVVHKNRFVYKNFVVDSEGDRLECWELMNKLNVLESA